MVPKECKHCGLHSIWHIDDDTVFACGTIYAGRGDYWNQSTGCVEIMRSRERIKRAVEVLEGSYRIIMVLNGDNEDVVFATDVDRAVGILEGDTDESAD